jgi:hypothetical protein
MMGESGFSRVNALILQKAYYSVTLILLAWDVPWRSACNPWTQQWDKLKENILIKVFTNNFSSYWQVSNWTRKTVSFAFRHAWITCLRSSGFF